MHDSRSRHARKQVRRRACGCGGDSGGDGRDIKSRPEPHAISGNAMWIEGQCARNVFNLVQYSVNFSGGGAIFKAATLVKALSCLRRLEESGVPLTIDVISASISICIKLLELRDVTYGIEKHFFLDMERCRRVPRDQLGRAEALVLTHVADMLYQTDGSNDCEAWSRLMGTEDIAWLCVEAMTTLDAPSSTTAVRSSLAAYSAVSRDPVIRDLGISTGVLERLQYEVGTTGSASLASEIKPLAWYLLTERSRGQLPSKTPMKK